MPSCSSMKPTAYKTPTSSPTDATCRSGFRCTTQGAQEVPVRAWWSRRTTDEGTIARAPASINGAVRGLVHSLGGVESLRALEHRSFQVRFREVGTGDIGSGHIRAGQLRSKEIGTLQIGSLEIGKHHQRPVEVR